MQVLRPILKNTLVAVHTYTLGDPVHLLIIFILIFIRHAA